MLKNKKHFKGESLVKLGGTVLLTIAVYMVPKWANGYVMTVLNTSIVYYITCLGVSVVMGMCGQMNFSSSAFMGLGGFVAAQIALKTSISPIFALIISVVLVTLAAILLAFPLMRLDGIFFALASMSLVMIASCLYSNYRPLTGGPDGIYGIPKLTLFGKPVVGVQNWFYLLCFFALLCIMIVNRIRKSSLGRSFICVRDDPTAAKTLGINVYKTKIIAFAICGAYAGLAGALLAFHNRIISPSLFSQTQNTNYVVMVMLGGVESSIGTLFGTIFVTLAPELLRPVKEYLTLINGIIIILLMIFMPTGLAGVYQKLVKALKKCHQSAKEGRRHAKCS